jgi:hypothetical protein
MEIAFVKTGGSHDRIHVRRDDGSEAAWRWGAGGPPHDLIHWVVESRLPLRRGFWGLVCGGADFGFVNSHAHGAKRDPSPELGDTTELIQAEAVVNSIQMGERLEPQLSDTDCLEWTRRWCEEGKVPLPAGLDESRLGALRAETADWSRRYGELEAGQALDVSWSEPAQTPTRFRSRAS